MRRWILALVGLSILLLALTCVEGWLRVRGPGREALEFQRLTGGLGMGSTAALYWDFSTFDPRLEPDCTCSLWPVPGGYLFSPEHRSTVWDPPEALWYAIGAESLGREEMR
jgi:hypothetical protein